MLPILQKVRFKVQYWPVLTGSWFIITFFITYIMAVYNGHIYYFWPYISDTGVFPPESCFFSLFTNLGVVFLVITLYIRNVQVKYSFASSAITTKFTLNNISLCSGYLACIGLDIVANFQESPAVQTFHYSGATAIFIFGSVYIVTQTIISRNLLRHGVITQYTITFITYYLRIAIAVLIFPFFITNVTLSGMSFDKYNGTNIYQWSPDEPYHDIRLGATITEWILFLFFGGFLMTYFNEFKALQFNGISFKSRIGLSKFENQERVV